MATITDSGIRPADLLLHRALRYGYEDQFLEVSVPFLREGLDRGGCVVVISENAPLLRRALPGAGDVEFIDAAAWFGSPARTLTAYLAHAREHWWPRGPLYLLAEPVWRRCPPLEIGEWGRVESLLNVAFARTPSRILCAYDLRSVPAEAADDVDRTHPEVIGIAGCRLSPRFTDPAVFSAERNRAPLRPPADPVDGIGFDGPGDLAGVRAFVGERARRRGLGRERSLALVQSAGEVAAHVVRNGGGHGAVWLWCDLDTLICDVIDAAAPFDDRFLGYFPPSAYRPAGAGMWAVRQLCDLVEVRSGRDGSVVRLHMRRAPR